MEELTNQLFPRPVPPNQGAQREREAEEAVEKKAKVRHHGEEDLAITGVSKEARGRK